MMDAFINVSCNISKKIIYEVSYQFSLVKNTRIIFYYYYIVVIPMQEQIYNEDIL